MATFYSGGFKGGDYLWAKIAYENKHKIIQYALHKPPKDKIIAAAEYITLDECALKDGAHKKCLRTNKRLKRSYPCRAPCGVKLLRNCYFQIKDIDSLYAIGTFKNVESNPFRVDGGVAWPISLFIDKILEIDVLLPLPVYFLNQGNNQWYTPIYTDNNQVRWNQLSGLPPKPTGNYGTASTIELNDKSITQIVTLYRVEN